MPGCVQDFNRDLVQGFFGVLLEALGILLGLDFWLHSIMPVTWNPEYPPWEYYTVKSKTYNCSVSLQIVNTQYYIPFKIPVSVLFLK